MTKIRRAVRWYCDNYLNTTSNKHSQRIRSVPVIPLITCVRVRKILLNPLKGARRVCELLVSHKETEYTIENYVQHIERSTYFAGSNILETPVKVEWHITKRCNLRCVFCYSDAEGKSDYEDELTTEEALDVVRQLSECNVIEVQIEGGEPCLRLDLLEIIAALKKDRHRVRLLINGTLLNRELVKELSSLLTPYDVLQVSIHGSTATVHDQLTGSQGSFDRLVEGMNLLREVNIPVRVSTVITPVNISDLPEIVLFIAQYPNVNVFVAQPAILYGRASQEDIVDTKELLLRYYEIAKERKKKSHPGLALLLGHAYHIPEMEEYVFRKGIRNNLAFCSAARSRIHIAPNGDVFPCHFLTDNVFRGGNVREQPLYDLWNSRHFDKVRAGRSPSSTCTLCKMAMHCTKRGLCTSFLSGRNFNSKPINCIYTTLLCKGGYGHA